MPRGRPLNIQHVYIADGFADDCDELIHQCSKVDILSYQTFCIYYKELNFASMYQGRTSNAEIAELSEEVLQMAKYYMVLDTSNFEESVAGLFLVYALLNLQPYPGFAPLRIVPDDLPAIARIQQVARREKRYDVLFILGSILIKGPVEYHADARERGMEGTIRKYLEGSCTMDIKGIRPKGVYFRQNEELDIIREMTGIFKRYSKAKEQIPGLKSRGLNYSNDELATDLGTSLKRLINGITEEDGTGSVDRSSAVQEIKHRAMRGTVNTVKHLETAEQRSPKKRSAQQTDSTSPSTPETPPTPKNTNTTNNTTTPKRAAKAKPKVAKKSRKDSSSSSSSEKSEEEVFCTKRGKSVASLSLKKIDIDPDEREINIEIDALPPLITTESNGKVVEIEIMDNMKPKGKRNAKKKKVTDEKEEVFKRPLRVSPRIKKVQRNELKQPILKSKFRKMGMLPVANFKDSK